MATNYVPAVDYTSRDYASILADMTALIPNFTPNWTNRDPSDFGMVLIELFAYMGDILSYYIDRSANESMINTATQRQSLLDIAALLGYVPTLSTPATSTLTITNNTGSAVTLPALTQVATSLVNNATTTQIIFETNNAVTIPASSGSVSLSSVSGVAASSSSTVTGTIGTTTLTVTSPSSPLAVGMLVTGTGIPINTRISAVTGTGPYTVTITSPIGAAGISGTYTFGAIAQYTSVSAHGLVTGQVVTITGFTPSGYNTAGATIYVSSTTTFTVDNTTLGVASGTGTATYSVGGGTNQATVVATQGQTVSNEIIGTSNGLAAQTYQLSNTGVINNSIVITINGTTYAYVPYLVDYGTYDPVFSSYTDETGVTYIRFGDGVSGRVPPSGAQIYATYRVGGGLIGNVAAGLLKNIIYVPGSSTTPAGIAITNTAATGGSDPESNDSIRYNAPLSLRALNRAVTANDHSALATQVVGVSKASAASNQYSAVTVYVLPQGDTGVSSSDNSTATTTFTKRATDVTTYMADKTHPGTTVTVQPPKWIGVYLTVNVIVSSTYNQTSVKNNVIAALQNLYFVDNVNFGQTTSIANLYNVINSVPGVSSSTIVKHVRADADQTYTVTNRVLTSGVATLTATSHTLAVGQSVSVSGYTGTDAIFNGTFIVTAIATNTFSYALASANVTTGAGTGTATVTALTVGDIKTAVSELPTLYAMGTTASSSTPWVGSLTVNATGGITQ